MNSILGMNIATLRGEHRQPFRRMERRTEELHPYDPRVVPRGDLGLPSSLEVIVNPCDRI
jgi:hypothetical protein